MNKESATVIGIDRGTNSIRLKTARVDADGMREVVSRILCVICLDQGVDKTRRFADEALERTYVAARESAGVTTEYPIDGLRFVTTSATRSAKNREEFKDEIEHVLGVRPEVVPGTEGADLSFLGATSVVNRDDLPTPYLMVDLGGGSTEPVIGGDGVNAPITQIQGAFSMNIDSMRMTERHLINDPPTQTQIDEAAADVDEHIGKAFRTVNADKTRTVIGVPGTVTTMTTLAMGLKGHDHTIVDGHRLNLGDAYAVDDKFLRVTRAERHKYKTIHPDRIDVVGGGAVVWSRVLARVNETTKADHGEATDSFVVSGRGLPDGIVLDYGHRLLA